MTCPPADRWDLLAMDVLEPHEAEPLRAHARACAACREAYRAAREAHVARVAAYEAFEQDHERLRDRLMAALPPREPGPRVGRLRRLVRGLKGDAMNRHRRAARLAAAVLVPAACIVLAWMMLSVPTSSSVFAAALERMRHAETIVSRFRAYLNDSEAPSQTGSMYLSSCCGSRFEAGAFAGVAGGAMTIYGRPDGTTVIVSDTLPAVLRLHRPAGEPLDALGFDFHRSSPAEFLENFLSLVGEADRELGEATIDGRRAAGFEVDGRRIGLSTPGAAGPENGPRSAVRLWVDLETKLPLRFEVDAYQPGGPLAASHVRTVFDQFRFDVPLEPDFFEPRIGPDTKVVDIDVPPVSEQTLVRGLRLYSAALGHYPAVLDAARMSAEYAVAKLAAGEVDREQVSRGELPPEFMGEALLLARAAEFCRRLERAGGEVEYFGESVTPGDAEAVLLRWRSPDGRRHVLYGDLRLETIERASSRRP